MLSDAELWQLTKEARSHANAAQREADEEPSPKAHERWLKAKADYERLARQWQARIGGIACG
jgi:hypothetical protein